MKYRQTTAITALAVLILAGFIPATATRAQVDNGVAAPVRYDGHKVVRANIRTARDLRTMETLSPDCWTHGSGIGKVDYRIPPDAMEALDASGIEYEVLIENVQTLIDAEKQGNGQDGWYDQYHTLAEIEAHLQELVDTYPTLAETIVIGTSLEGRPIRGIRIVGAGGSGGKPDVMYAGGIHAREWITTMAMPYLAETLLTSYGTDPLLTELVDRINFYVVPVQNVDGFSYTQSNRMWRKNRRPNGDGSFGVDLNRNYATGWGGEGSSGSTSSETYRGTAPFSEPESQAMRDYLLSLPNLSGFMDVHSYGQLILQPFGYTSQYPPDHATFEQIGGDMEVAMESPYGTNYVHGNTYDTIYPASGITQDWAYVEGGAWALGYELRDTGQYGFLLPPEQIIPSSEECFAGCMELAKFLTTRLRFSFPNGLPAYVDPNAPAAVQVQISGANGGQYQSGTGKVWSRIGTNGAFTDRQLNSLGGDLYEATLPAADCGQVIQFYFEATSVDGYTHYAPADAPAGFYQSDVAYVDVFFTDDFETNQGWTVQNQNVTDGAWERGVPVGGGAREDPPTDFDGSGQCYLTANRSGNSDLDGGPTILTSPVFDMSGGDGSVSYARWYRSVNGVTDQLTVQISNDNGSNWTTVELIGNQPNAWAVHEFRVSDFVQPTANMRLRFSAIDNPNDSVVEVGVDAVFVARIGCNQEGMQLAVGPLTAGQVGRFDVTNANPNQLTYLAYSVRGLGSTYVAPLNVTLDLRSPVQAGSPRRADGNGAATWNLPIPGNAGGRTVWFQAAQFENTSNVVESLIN